MTIQTFRGIRVRVACACLRRRRWQVDKKALANEQTQQEDSEEANEYCFGIVGHRCATDWDPPAEGY